MGDGATWLDERAAREIERGGGDTTDHRQTVQRLAALDPVAYDRQRQAEAERMGCRTSTLDTLVKSARSDDDDSAGTSMLLDDVEPCSSPVEGAALLTEIATTIQTYMVLPTGAANAIALWTMHAWTHDASRVSPLLAITSPEKRCGKSTLLALIQRMTPRALPTSNITAASLFRAVEKWSPTLLIDEADTFLRSSDELRGILNSGHTSDSAYVIRTVGDDHEPRAFRTWSPKAVALIGRLPSTLTDRSILIPLRRRMPTDPVERLRLDRISTTGTQSRAARWAADHADSLRDADPHLPETLHDRAADNWRPLAAIAELTGGDWPDRLLSAIAALASDDDDGDGARTALLHDLRTILAGHDEDRVTSDTLVEALVSMEGRPWPEWNKGRPLSKNGLARLLRPFGIRPRKIRIGSTTSNGYRADDFGDAFGRYLPGTTGTSEHPQQNAGSSKNATGTRTDHVPVADSPQSASRRHCSDVPDEKQEHWEATL